ncbi:hypothetical protein SAMN05216490_4907 [Mucilaginibacter mallensis]|uniref:Uncharacterized protein n=1 Tax=Mucilaginibacter mallensis TaxID=652787 RepID=A0A1H2CDM0_MUCMA|nr:hypothetical protein SAMN05216490_4907 [Mucilaginibacter mallensis]
MLFERVIIHIKGMLSFKDLSSELFLIINESCEQK